MKNPADSIQGQLGRFYSRISLPWIIVILAALLLFVSNINANTFGIFFKPISEEFGWSRGAVSGAFALRALVVAVLVLPVGYLADQYGPRRLLLPSFLCIGGGFLLTSRITSLWQLYIIQSLIMGIGMSAPFVCVMSTVAKWHTKRPGLALGLTSAGTGLSSVLFPPAAATLINSLGWREAVIILGLITLAVAVPAAIFMKDPPSVKEQRHERPGESRSRLAVWRKLPGLLKNRIFFAIAMIFLLFYIACNLLTTHLVNYVTDMGISALIAASMVSVMGIVSTIGRLSMGTISDRIGARIDTMICCAAVGLSIILLMLKIPALMWVAVALFGIGFGGMAPLIPAIMGEYFGWENLSTITGAVTIGSNLGGAIGPWIGGYIFDVSGSYLGALALITILTIAALIIAARLPSAEESKEKGQDLLN